MTSVADYCVKHFKQILERCFNTESGIHEAIKMTYKILDKQLMDDNVKGGSTALSCMLIPLGNSTIVITSNVGDSRAVLYTKGVTSRVSFDHKPNDPSEWRRILDAGGYVSDRGTARLNGCLSVSRALGDFDVDDSKNALSVEPHINITIANKGFLIMACDGLWDVISDLDATAFVSSELGKGKEVEDIAKRITELAIDKKSQDNISVIIILL